MVSHTILTRIRNRFDVLTDANLGNQKRVLEMLKESKARFRSSVVGAGNTYASIRLSSRYSLPGEMREGR